VGYFVAPKAKEHIVKQNRQYFIEEELPEFVQRMNMLGLTWEDLMQVTK
jgi:DNA-binding transcriptional regulator YhcF (GntR family)